MRRVPVRSVLVAGLSVVVLAFAALGQLTGRLDLDAVARRIPTTVTGEIKLDTPSEFTMLEFAIASKIDLTLRTGFIDPRVKAAINTAGIEHFVLSSPFEFGELPFYGAQLDEFTLVPEVWVAVPFENVTDVNNLPNSVIIPPANPLFVSARATLSASVGGFDIEHLIMLEDVNFPNPSGSYDPLYYGHSDQEFGIGSLTSASWRASVGLSMRAELGLSASSANKSIKGHSAKGKVTPDSSFVRLGIGGIRLASVSLFGVGIQDVTLGSSFSVATGTDEAFSTTVTIAGAAWEGSSLSLSITLTSSPPTVSALMLTVTEGPFRLSIALDELDITGLSASCGNSLNLGPISGSWSLRASGIERGLTGLAMGLSLAQGVFSTNTSITFSQRGEDFGFASWSSKLSFRFSPAVVSAQATFGRYGLTRAAVTTSVSF
jgi:hypothetical protein